MNITTDTVISYWRQFAKQRYNTTTDTTTISSPGNTTLDIFERIIQERPPQHHIGTRSHSTASRRHDHIVITHVSIPDEETNTRNLPNNEKVFTTDTGSNNMRIEPNKLPVIHTITRFMSLDQMFPHLSKRDE